MHHLARGVFIAVLAPITVLALAGCFSSPLIGSEPELALIASGEYELIEGLNVPHVRGEDGCGAQALATVLAHIDETIDATQLAEELPWHDLGATPIDLLLAARSRGREARIAVGSIDDLANLVHEGRPALVMIDAAIEVRTLMLAVPTPKAMHWSVVSGVALDGSAVLLAEVDSRHHVVDSDDFLTRWAESDRCMIIVTAH